MVVGKTQLFGHLSWVSFDGGKASALINMSESSKTLVAWLRRFLGSTLLALGDLLRHFWIPQRV